MVTQYLIGVVNELKGNPRDDLDSRLRDTFLILLWDIKRVDANDDGSLDDLRFLTRAYHRATVQRDVFKETVGRTFDEIDGRYPSDGERRLRKQILVLLDLAVAQFNVSLKEMAAHCVDDLEVLTI